MGRGGFPAAYLALFFGSVVAIPRIPRSPARRRALRTQWRATATSKHNALIKKHLHPKTAARVRKELQIPLRGRPPAYVAADAAARTSNCIRAAWPGDVVGIYWSDSPGPASEGFYWRATVEEDDGQLYVASPDWPRERFDPLEDWWVMYEKKSRKRSRDDDDGVDDASDDEGVDEAPGDVDYATSQEV